MEGRGYCLLFLPFLHHLKPKSGQHCLWWWLCHSSAEEPQTLRAKVLSFPILPVITNTQLSTVWECRLKREKTNPIWLKSIFRMIQTIGTGGEKTQSTFQQRYQGNAQLPLPERITFPSNFDKYHQTLNVSPLCYPQMRTSIWKSSQNL